VGGEHLGQTVPREGLRAHVFFQNQFVKMENVVAGQKQKRGELRAPGRQGKFTRIVEAKKGPVWCTVQPNPKIVIKRR